MPAHDRTEWVPSPAPGVALDAGHGNGSDGPSRLSHERLGPYRLVEEIGEGGMGVVHLALDTRGRAVAIKVLRAHVAHDSDARTRLGREVETLSRIRDDRVASVIDADVMGPRPYIVTRYVHGPALDEAVEADGPLGPAALLRLARGTAEAIRGIHACGVVHRDIKPGNVLLEDGEPVLIDFGIAHLQDDVRHTVGGLVMGTPGYLSPELVEGAAITDATDWWGWAATITFAASGRPPFGRGRMDAVLSRVRAGEVDLEGIDPRLAPLLRASLSPRPSQRPHAGEVIDALERYAAGQAATVPAPSGGPWDDPDGPVQVEPPPVGSTQVLLERETNVMPSISPAAFSEPAQGRSRFEPVGSFEPGGQHDSPRWAPPAAGAAASHGVTHDPDDDWDHRARRGADHPSHTTARDGGGEPAWLGDPDWDENDETVEREGDPRIGMPLRTGLIAGLAVAWLGALAAWPGVAGIALVVWSAFARATDRSVTGLVLRRYDHGRRRSDVPWAVAMSPWHLVVGAVASAVSLLLPLAVTLAGIFASALLLAGAGGTDLDPGDPVTLVVGGALGLLMVWWGPGGASLRRGSRSITRTLVPAGLPSQVVAGALAVFGAVTALVAIRHGLSYSWTPFGGNPLGP